MCLWAANRNSSAVFLLGPHPEVLTPWLRWDPENRFLVVHVHFNRNGLLNNRLAIDAINIRHANYIRAQQEPPVPGLYRAEGQEPRGQLCFQCINPRTGFDRGTRGRRMCRKTCRTGSCSSWCRS